MFFLRDTNSPLMLLNNWSNFPLGLVTAIFTPDSQVFLCYTGSFQASACYTFYLDWLTVTAGSLGAYLAIFFIVNLGQSARELGIRSFFYSAMILAISVVSNYLGLLREPGSIGPSTAIYASLGLGLGFAFANSIAWLLSGRSFSNQRQVWAVGMSITLTTGLIVFALADPVGFFNVSSTQRIDATAHMFCFTVGALVSLPVGLRSVRVSLIGIIRRQSGTSAWTKIAGDQTHPWCFYPVPQTSMPHWIPETLMSSGIEPPRVRNPSGPQSLI